MGRKKGESKKEGIEDSKGRVKEEDGMAKERSRLDFKDEINLCKTTLISHHLYHDYPASAPATSAATSNLRSPPA